MTRELTDEYRTRVYVGVSEESFGDALHRAWQLAQEERSGGGDTGEVHLRIVERWAIASNPITGFCVAAVVGRPH
jgi:hypothetical protein